MTTPPAPAQRFLAPARPISPGLTVRRALPVAARRQVGAWTFLDHIGPVPAQAPPLAVGEHPHIGLQTATWLFEGEILHRDGLGTEQPIRPGQLNLMTAGRGIAHTEEGQPGALHGVQFWIALPAAQEAMEPAFEHHAELPSGGGPGFRAIVFIGEGFGLRSPARVHSPLVGAELLTEGAARLPLRPDFEHALLLVEGEATLSDGPLRVGELLYLPPGREALGLEGAARLVLIGGEPLPEPRVLWWNFVARSWEEIEAARADWEARRTRFSPVEGGPGHRLNAPELPG